MPPLTILNLADIPTTNIGWKYVLNCSISDQLSCIGKYIFHTFQYKFLFYNYNFGFPYTFWNIADSWYHSQYLIADLIIGTTLVHSTNLCRHRQILLTLCYPAGWLYSLPVSLPPSQLPFSPPLRWLPWVQTQWCDWNGSLGQRWTQPGSSPSWSGSGASQGSVAV